MNHIEQILYSDVKIEPLNGAKCEFTGCTKPAEHIWPTNAEKPGRFCKKHLEASREKLQVALGLADAP